MATAAPVRRNEDPARSLPIAPAGFRQRRDVLGLDEGMVDGEDEEGEVGVFDGLQAGLHRGGLARGVALVEGGPHGRGGALSLRGEGRADLLGARAEDDPDLLRAPARAGLDRQREGASAVEVEEGLRPAHTLRFPRRQHEGGEPRRTAHRRDPNSREERTGIATRRARAPSAKRRPGPRTRTSRPIPDAGRARRRRSEPGETPGVAARSSSAEGSVTDVAAVERPGARGLGHAADERPPVAEQRDLALLRAEPQEELVPAHDRGGRSQAPLERLEVELARRGGAELDRVPPAERRDRGAALAAQILEAAFPARGAVLAPL